MMESHWWIREIDWRISTGIIFSIQLIFWNCEERRKNWLLRICISFVILCTCSWSMRFLLEEGIAANFYIAFGYSLYIMFMSMFFILCYSFCYHSSKEVTLFLSMIALTVYRMAWNSIKLISTIPVGKDVEWSNGSVFQSAMSYLFYFCLTLVAYKLFQRFVKQPIVFQFKMSVIFASILLCQMLLEFTFQYFYRGENQVVFFLTALLYSIMNFVLLIMIAFLNMLRIENAGLENFIASKQKYYEISREGILSLRVKCHDLKHQIAMIRSAEGEHQLNQYINSLSDSIDEYNTVISTGNPDIDVVLTEKNIICSINKIRFSYMIDGTLFSFLSDMEIYSLFGNALDNAIESMTNVKQREKVFISLKANKREDRLVVVIENYYEHIIEFQDGIPVTNKIEKNMHGFGLRSIRAIAREHEGEVIIQADNNIFKLVISMRTGNKNKA